MECALGYEGTHARERAGHTALVPAVPCGCDLFGVGDDGFESCVDPCKVLSHSLKSSSQSSVSESKEEESYGSDIQSGHNVDVVDVLVGIGRLFLEILIAGNDLGEVDLGGGDGEPEAEAGSDIEAGEHGVCGMNFKE